MQETQVWSLGWEDPLEEEMATHSSILAWKFHAQRSLAGYTVHGVAKSQTWLSDWAHRPWIKVGLFSTWDFPGGTVLKHTPANAGDTGLIPRLGRSPGGGNGNALQYSCLENPHEQRSLVGYSLWGHKESDRTKRLNNGNSEPIGMSVSR